MTTIVPAVDERLAPTRLTALGLRHAPVRPAGAIATPVIVGWALKPLSNPVATRLHVDLFAGGIGRSRDAARAALRASAANAEPG